MSFTLLKHHLAVIGFLSLIASTSQATHIEVSKKNLIQPIAISPWQFEFGPRYWYSSARYKENLLGNAPAILVSRLTYENLSANSAEGFWKLEHQNGVYLKGYVGGGSINSGQLIDEDFPPGITPYSRTLSLQKKGSLSYFSADLGYDLFTAATWRLGGFIGYHYWQEQLNNFGCQQTASGPICLSSIVTEVDVLGNSASWNSLRLGVNGTIHLNDSWRLETDLAYIHSTLNENDFHNLRPSIRGLLDTGTGNGFQIDLLLKKLLTEELSLAAGGRWWYLATDGWAHFEQTAVTGQPQPLNGILNRYGLLVQANYQFLDKPNISKDKDLIDVIDFDWRGAYLGINLGYSTSPSMLYFSPTSATAQILQANSFSPYSLNIQNEGFLAGGQLGYYWQVNQVILGLEGDIDYAQIGGANAMTSSFPLVTTVQQNIRWLSTFRGKIGKLASPSMLVYLTTGPAWSRISLSFNQLGSPSDLTAVINNTQTGWTVGAGVEYTVAPHMTFKAEYLYLDLGTLNLNAIGSPSPDQVNYLVRTGFNENIVRLGINYKL